MTSLPPLIDSSSSERGRELLRAARADGPRSSAAQRTLAALGVVGSTATAAGAALGSAGAHAGAAAATAGTVAGLPLVAVKWLLVGTLSGLALASGATFAFSQREAASSAQPLVAAPLAPAPRKAEPAPHGAEPSTPAATETDAAAPAAEAPAAPIRAVAKASTGSATPQVDTVVPSTAPSQATFDAPEQSKLLHDVALLDDVRHALQGGDAARALSLVARYEQERQTHVLDREADILRERALAFGNK